MWTFTTLLIVVFPLLVGLSFGENPRRNISKRSFDTEDRMQPKKKKTEEEIVNRYLNKDKGTNGTYREEFCKAKNWSIKYGW